MSARRMGQGIMNRSTRATPADAAAARALDWTTERAMGMWQAIDADPKAFLAYLGDLRETGSEMRALELSFTRAGIALEPPVGWESRFKQGKVEAGS